LELSDYALSCASPGVKQLAPFRATSDGEVESFHATALEDGTTASRAFGPAAIRPAILRSSFSIRTETT